MANDSEITLDEIAKEIGVGTTTLDREIAKMTDLVQRIGSKKVGTGILLITVRKDEYNISIQYASGNPSAESW